MKIEKVDVMWTRAQGVDLHIVMVIDANMIKQVDSLVCFGEQYVKTEEKQYVSVGHIVDEIIKEQ